MFVDGDTIMFEACIIIVKYYVLMNSVFKFNSTELNPQVEQYLAEYLSKPLHPSCSLLAPLGIKSGRPLQRRMSVKGAVKKTRSILSSDGRSFIFHNLLLQY